MTTGLSSIPARLSPSVMRAKPPPLVVTRALPPAYHAPMALLMAAISSSAWSTTIPNSLASWEREMRTPVEGDMG